MTESEEIVVADRNIFGEVSCEQEIQRYGVTRYQQVFFEEAPFLDAVLDERIYLIVGRRGTGKTSIANYFEFQEKYKSSTAIDVNEPDVYTEILSRASVAEIHDEDSKLNYMLKVWKYIFWSMIFESYRTRAISETIAQPAEFIKKAILDLMDRFTGRRVAEYTTVLDEHFNDAAHQKAVEEVMKVCAKCPLIIAMDSLERYDTNNEDMMIATAALVQFASGFNLEYAHRGLHLKVFVSSEIFPSLSGRWISNSLKYIRDPVYLHWRPKDILRLICWRLWRSGSLKSSIDNSKSIDWNNYNEVREEVWNPFFGKKIKNCNGKLEDSFPYLLRHTQLRPRQVIVLCNRIAQACIDDGSFPQFSHDVIRRQVIEGEEQLADEIINSYARVHENVREIVSSLSGSPSVFKGNYLDKIAPRTAAAWNGKYSPYEFKCLLTELGVVGRIRNGEPSKGDRIGVDFEYALKSSVSLQDDTWCAIHPMFYKWLSIANAADYVVYPFPDHPDFEAVGF